MGQHINAMKAGTFDGGYTLEPNATVMNQLGYAKTVEAGVIAEDVLGDPEADPFAAGCAFSSDFINKRPDVAKRFAQAWAKALVVDQERSAGGAQAPLERTRSRRRMSSMASRCSAMSWSRT